MRASRNASETSIECPFAPVEMDKEEVDVEKEAASEGGDALQREASGPPHSIFSKRMKVWIIVLVSWSALISPFGATFFLPALNVLSDVLHITPTQTNLAVTTYMVRSKCNTKVVFQCELSLPCTVSRRLI